jgi:hypothetical protein
MPMGRWALTSQGCAVESGGVKTVLLIINGPAYGSDETYNAVRLAAVALARRGDVSVRVFLMGMR